MSRVRVHRPQLDMTGDPLLSGRNLSQYYLTKSSFQQGSKFLMETVNLHFRFGFFAGSVVIVRESH